MWHVGRDITHIQGAYLRAGVIFPTTRQLTLAHGGVSLALQKLLDSVPLGQHCTRIGSGAAISIALELNSIWMIWIERWAVRGYVSIIPLRIVDRRTVFIGGDHKARARGQLSTYSEFIDSEGEDKSRVTERGSCAGGNGSQHHHTRRMLARRRMADHQILHSDFACH